MNEGSRLRSMALSELLSEMCEKGTAITIDWWEGERVWDVEYIAGGVMLRCCSSSLVGALVDVLDQFDPLPEE